MARTSIIRRLPAALAAALVLGVAGAPPPAAALTPRPVDGVFGVISAGQPTGRATITRQGTRIAPGATFYADCRKLMVPTGIVVRSGRFDYRGRVAGRAGTLH